MLVSFFGMLRYLLRSSSLQIILSVVFAIIIIMFSYTSSRSSNKGTAHIITQSGDIHLLDIDIIEEAHELTTGLMFRENIPDNYGMLFDLRTEETVSFWMKNTRMPLDIIFLNDKGVVVDLVKNAIPLSEEVRSSAVPARFMLEVTAGTIERLNITAGLDKICSLRIGRVLNAITLRKGLISMDITKSCMYTGL